MEPLRDDRLIAELQALRPTPRPAFTAELDERAAAGFPRRSRRSPLARLAECLRVGGPRRLLIPIGGLAVLAIAVATAVLAVGNGGSRELLSGIETTSRNFAPRAGHNNNYQRAAKGAAPVGKGSAAANSASSESETVYGLESTTLPGEASADAEQSAPAPGPLTHGASHRDVERSATITIAAEPKDVADDASQVFEAVHTHYGIVMRSSTSQGKAGEAGARFDLLIPSRELAEAMAAFSRIDAVRSRHEATVDITAPTVSTSELLQESRARIDSLLGQLSEAETESEREAVEAELRHERRHAGRLAAQLTRLNRRADYSRVSLQIVSGDAESSAGGAWGFGDALHAAGRILAVAAAVLLVALAILGPIALVALLAWATHRAWVRRQRRRVLS
jgi:hypothetical protein